jgi:hypothetical protein
MFAADQIMAFRFRGKGVFLGNHQNYFQPVNPSVCLAHLYAINSRVKIPPPDGVLLAAGAQEKAAPAAEILLQLPPYF